MHCRGHLSDRVCPPIEFHFQADESQKPVAAVFVGDALHGCDSSLEFLVEPFDDTGAPLSGRCIPLQGRRRRLGTNPGPLQ